MTIVLTGGGSGGHITPLLAVAEELKSKNPETRIIYIGHKGDSLADIGKAHSSFDETYFVRAGKFRRYHGEGWKQILDITTLFRNIRDVFNFLIGIIQSKHLLKKLHPDVIFIKGGFVGVPVGLSAGRLGIPYITHDSDIVPGLANKLIAKKASMHAVALPKEQYNYPPDKTITIGVPISREYKPVTTVDQAAFRGQLGLDTHHPVLCVTGGGLGAQRLNKAMSSALTGVLFKIPELRVLHITGRANELDQTKWYDQNINRQQRSQIIVKGFVDDLYRYSGAADLIVCRAGATNLAEFALQQKACLVVPNPNLTGGHQTKNADFLAKTGAIDVIHEEELSSKNNALADHIVNLLGDQAKRQEMGRAFHHFAKPEATSQLADLIVHVAMHKVVNRATA